MQYADSKAFLKGVGGRGVNAVIGGNAYDIHCVYAVLAQPVSEQGTVRSALESRIGGGVFALAEVGLRRPDSLMHSCAVGLGYAVHRPRIDKIRVLRKVRTRIDVPILRGYDGFVILLQGSDFYSDLIAPLGA